ncbi:DUF349 domain-containing protein [Cyclobacterium roseum]|uniref:DUF349 domain-containing protein n=1 Tax=Cyclobacterium roseum TaxID=2666137 RepID=UPI001F27D2F5|nr:DUF349 domain-containing protein [Cyclobacterium roseum]
MDKDKEISGKTDKVTEDLVNSQKSGLDATEAGNQENAEQKTEAPKPQDEESAASQAKQEKSEDLNVQEGQSEDHQEAQQKVPESEAPDKKSDPTQEAQKKGEELTDRDDASEENQEGPQEEEELKSKDVESDPAQDEKEKAEEQKAQDSDTDENQEEEHEEEVHFNNFTKPQLLKALKEFAQEQDFIKRDGLVQEIKNHYEEFYSKEKEEALQQFIKEGGEEGGFDYRGSDADREFFATYQQFKDKKHQQVKDFERSKEKNAQEKNGILDQLRNLVDGEETTNSIETIKKIQEEWKKIGPVPHSQNKNLWASYNALMDRFYDNRSIYFELKELDRKKNLESKLELCDKAEALLELEDIKEAIRVLNDLHEEFKHIGPVPREEQEALWTRFKAASDAVYNKRKAYYDSQKEVFKANQELKEKLIEKLNAFKEFKAEKIRDWNSKTKEILAIQKEWEAIGPVPRESGREINKTFWGLFKQFFHHKNQFFKELDEIRNENKEKAEELIADAESHKESTDWKETSNHLIQLQKKWKELGPLPEKFRDDLYTRFKKSCDTFFNNRRDANKETNKAFEENLAAKEDVCTRILTASKEPDEVSPDGLESLIREFNEIGFVPRKSMKDISAKFNEAVNSYMGKLDLEGESKDDFLFRLNLNKLQSDPNSTRVLNKKEHGIRKQISDLENNITLWRNNLEFFASSKTADKLKDQFEEKIDKAEQEVDKLKKKLSIIREF